MDDLKEYPCTFTLHDVSSRGNPLETVAEFEQTIFARNRDWACYVANRFCQMLEYKDSVQCHYDIERED